MPYMVTSILNTTNPKGRDRLTELKVQDGSGHVHQGDRCHCRIDCPDAGYKKIYHNCTHNLCGWAHILRMFWG